MNEAQVPSVKHGRVSFVVPTYDSARTIRICLKSLRAQTYEDIEIVVVDNGSHDGTVEVAHQFADLTITWGPERSAQRNRGATAATGEYLVFIDSDMLVGREVARQVVSELNQNPDIAALVLPERSHGHGFWARCKALEKELYIGDRWIEAARAFRRQVFFRFGGYDEGIHGGGEDWDLPERMVETGRTMGRISSETIHLEGRLSLLDDMRKKLYYGRTFGKYVRKHPLEAWHKIVRVRPARRLLTISSPLYILGIVVMKILEFGSLSVGMLLSLVRQHPIDRKARPQPVDQPGKIPRPVRDEG